VPEIPGLDRPHVVDYARVLRGEVPVGDGVVILGAGGIGFDTAVFLTQHDPSAALDRDRFFANWGVTVDPAVRGALVVPGPAKSRRSVTVLQRKATKPGAGLGRTTGWIHRAELRHRGVAFHAGVAYEQITDAGIEVTIDGTRRHLDADTVVVCTGQVSVDHLDRELRALGARPILIGGARLAGELDAKRAIREGTEAAATLGSRERVAAAS
jgi:2,4-dienoyl-CoA reductase (NADPH2)